MIITTAILISSKKSGRQPCVLHTFTEKLVDEKTI